MSVHDSERAIDRLAGLRNSMNSDDAAGYFLLALSILAWNAPEVANFILDRTAEQVAPPAATDQEARDGT